MKYTEVVGEIYRQIREKKGYTKEAVIKNLIGIKAQERFEENEMIPDFLLVERLFQRLGVSSDLFSIMIMHDEYDYCVWREEIIEKIVSGKVQDSDWNSKFAKDTTINKSLQEQFVRFWKGYELCDTEMMKNAIRITVPEYPDKMTLSQCIGREEFAYMLYYIERKLQKNPKSWIEEYETVKFILNYMNLNFEPQELVGIYGRAACVYGELIAIDNVDDKIHHYRSAINLQRKYARVSGLERLFHGLIQSYQELEQEIPSEDQKMYETIRAIKQEFDIKEEYAPEIKISNEIYLLEEVLKEYRLERGLTVTQAAEGVCDGKTYRALENGKRKPKRGTYKAIAEKFGIPLVKYNADIITDQYEYLEMLHEIKLISRKDVKGREQKLIDILEYKLGEWMNYPQNRQMIDSMRDVQEFLTGKISPDEYLERVKKCLDLTITDWNKDLQHHFYTPREIILVYYAAIAHRKRGRSDIAIEIVDNIMNYINHSNINFNNRLEEKLVLQILKKNLLTDLGRYEEALYIALEEIHFAFKTFRGDKLHDCLFELGWICEKGYCPESVRRIDKNDYIKYFKYALCVSEMFYIVKDQKVIKNHLS